MDAIAGLQELLSSTSGPVEIADQARRRIADIRTKHEEFQSLLNDWTEMERLYAHVAELDALVDTAQVAFDEATRDLEELFERIGPRLVATELSYDARKLESLIYIGRALGLRNGHCPLCDSNIDDEQFEHGLRTGLAMAQDLDGQAVELAERERAQVSAVDRVGATKSALDTAMEERQAVLLRIDRFNQRLEATGLSDVSVMSLSDMIDDLSREHGDIAKNLRLLDTMSYNQMLENVAAEMKLQKWVWNARRLDWVVRSLQRVERDRYTIPFDELLLRRWISDLNRVLPLMAEMYKRLRPHSIWDDIQLDVRGDVRRFLRLQVGDDINPQFVFSSGQRRATGLAYLLSVNLSIAWSKWRSLLLDDPVQHVDDFRTIHLAEVLAHLCRGGKQIVCAVEDDALADLMCRRLSSSSGVVGKRITLGNDAEGALGVVREVELEPLVHRSLGRSKQSLSA